MKTKIKPFEVWPEKDLLGKFQWYCTGLTPLAIFGPYHNEQEARNECAARMKSWLGQQRDFSAELPVATQEWRKKNADG